MTTSRPAIKNYLMDMDGVLVHEERLIPGADLFVKRLQQTGHRFLLLTNNSIYTPRDLAARLALTGLEVPETAIWTSALATARFLDTQRPQGTAYVLGEAGLTTALHQVGYVLTEREPDYVVVGETRAYSQQAITRAIRLIASGARFIATNPDPTVAALISKATGVRPYFVGKPNPLMMREALRAIDAHTDSTVMIGDRMDTDIVAGIEAGLQTILVLSGITGREEAQRFPFLPTRIVDSVADLVDDIGDEPRPAGWPPARRRIVQQAAADHVGVSAPNGRPPVRAANAS
jgi:NagD protein